MSSSLLRADAKFSAPPPAPTGQLSGSWLKDAKASDGAALRAALDLIRLGRLEASGWRGPARYWAFLQPELKAGWQLPVASIQAPRRRVWHALGRAADPCLCVPARPLLPCPAAAEVCSGAAG